MNSQKKNIRKILPLALLIGLAFFAVAGERLVLERLKPDYI